MIPERAALSETNRLRSAVNLNYNASLQSDLLHWLFHENPSIMSVFHGFNIDAAP